jgi:hypothetical protein
LDYSADFFIQVFQLDQFLCAPTSRFERTIYACVERLNR